MNRFRSLNLLNVILLIIVIVFIFSVYLSLYSPLFAKSIKAINDRELILSNNVENYSFIVTGHIYGSMSNPYPTSTILANIDKFNEMTPQFMILVGDIVIEPLKRDIILLKSSFFLKLDFPVFNAVGNHDWFQNIQNYNLGNLYTDSLIETYTLDAGGLYTKHFELEKSFYSFQYSTELFVFLNGESHNGFFSEEQWIFFLKNIEYFKNSKELRNIFIFSHRLLWARGSPPLDKIIPLSNSPSWNPKNSLMIADVFLPILKTIKDKYVYFISGDVGAGSNKNLFYEEDQNSNITYIATSIADTDKDLVLKTIIKSGDVQFVPISLTQQKLLPIESYGLSFWTGMDWNQHMIDRTLLASLKEEILKGLKRKSFWVGFVLSFFTCIIILVLVNLKKLHEKLYIYTSSNWAKLSMDSTPKRNK